MNYIVRSVREKDFKDLCHLSKGSHLYNFSHNREKIRRKIEVSLRSFSGKLKKQESEYFFVVESLKDKKVVGCSQVLAQQGTKKDPIYSFKISSETKWNSFLKKKSHFKYLELTKNIDGPTEVGGLIVTPSLRKNKERIGELVSYSRFLYVALKPKRFKKEICAFAFMDPVLIKGKVSPFWESFGARFTECSYDKARSISQKGQKEEFLSLFPKEGQKHYLCLMDGRIELMLSGVNDRTYPALRLLKKIGFRKTDYIDPFDGGPSVAVKVNELEVVKNGREFVYRAGLRDEKLENKKKLMGFIRNDEYQGGRVLCVQRGNEVGFSENVKKVFKLSDGEKVFLF